MKRKLSSCIYIVMCAICICIANSCVPCIETDVLLEWPDSVETKLKILVVDSTDEAVPYLTYSNITYSGEWANGLLACTINPYIVVAGDSIPVYSSIVDSALINDTTELKISFRINGEEIHTISSFPDTSFIKTGNMKGQYDLQMVCSPAFGLLHSGNFSLSHHMAYNWFSDFQFSYDRINADIAILKFDVHNTNNESKHAPVNNVTFKRENDAFSKHLIFNDSITIYDTIPLIDDSTFYYSLEGYYEQVPLGKSEHVVSVHKGEIVFSGEKRQHQIGSIDPIGLGLIPNIN